MPFRLTRHFPPLAVAALLIGTASGDDPPALQVSTAIPAGTRSYAPGSWGLVEVSVINRSKEPATVLSSLHFGDANQQYGREFRLPPRSRRFTWYPVLVPAETAGERASIDFESFSIDRTGASEAVIPDSTGRITSDGLLPVDRGGAITAWIGSMEPGDASNTEVSDLLFATRYSLGYSQKVVALRGLALPPGAETLQGIEHLVLSSDRPLADAAGLTAIREWTFRGGRLWILLDRVSPALIERLLGDACQVQTVDRISLSHVRLVGHGSAARSTEPEPREFERPAEMVRVLADGVELLHTVEGWPASFVQRVGRGEVLFTTLEPRAWLRPRPPETRRRRDWHIELPFVAGEPLSMLAERLMSRRDRQPDLRAAWETLLTEQVGCRIASRGTVLAALGMYCSMLIGAAVWTGRRGRLDRMAWLAPLISLAATGALAAVGLRTARAVPPTVAEGQLIETTPGSAEAQVSGLSLLYQQETTPAALGSQNGGILLPDMAGFSGEPRRMVWTDWDRWRFENLTLPQGVRVAPFQQDLTLPAPVVVTGQLGRDGFTGRVSGPLQELSDLVMTTPGGESLAIRIEAGGRLSAGIGDVLAPGEFLADSLLSDAQRRRQEFYRRLLGGRNERYRLRPTLLAWCRPLDLGFVYPSDVVRTGESVVAVPVTMERTPPGTPVVVPSPFVRTEAVSAPGGLAPSSLFDRQTGEPVERSGDLEAWLRLSMPREVVPIDLDELAVTVDVAGAAGELEILGRSDGRTERLESWNSPAGSSRFTIRRADVLRLDEGGSLRIGFRVRGADRPIEEGTLRSAELKQFWKIESLRFDASGRTRENGAGAGRADAQP